MSPPTSPRRVPRPAAPRSKARRPFELLAPSCGLPRHPLLPASLLTPAPADRCTDSDRPYPARRASRCLREPHPPPSRGPTTRTTAVSTRRGDNRWRSIRRDFLRVFSFHVGLAGPLRGSHTRSSLRHRAQPAKGSALDIPAEPSAGCQCLLARCARLRTAMRVTAVQNLRNKPHSGPMAPEKFTPTKVE